MVGKPQKPIALTTVAIEFNIKIFKTNKGDQHQLTFFLKITCFKCDLIKVKNVCTSILWISCCCFFFVGGKPVQHPT